MPDAPVTRSTLDDLRLAAGDSLAAGPPWIRGEARLEAELLLAATLGLERWQLRSRGTERVPADTAARFRALVARRLAGEPLHYLLGRREFWSLELQVAPGVLVPRADTECLVEQALLHLDTCLAAGADSYCVLDLGTGSGAIALAIASERPDVHVTAVEASPAAACIAAANIARLAPGRVELLTGHWYTPVSGRRFHVIVANPPYLAVDDPHLPSLAGEPLEALVSGPDGLEAFREIIAGATAHLLPGGWLGLEHGATQGPAVRALLQSAGLHDVTTHRDLAGLERVSGGVMA